MCDFVANKIPGGYFVNGRVTGRAAGEYVLVMDTSGSMGNHACDILTTVGKTIARAKIPAIDIITFSHCVQRHKNVAANGFPEIIARYRTLGNWTRMKDAISMLADYALRDFTTIIVISDGELHDREETMKMCERMRSTFARSNVSVYAIRLHTTQSSPETLGLAGVMAMGNVHSSELIDVNGATDYHDMLSVQLESIMTMPCMKIMSTEERLAHTQTSAGVKSIVTPGSFFIRGTTLPSIWVGGHPVSIDVATQSIGVYLDRIAEDIESRVRLARVTGNKQECEAILAHIRQAEEELAREEAAADDALGASRVRRAIAEARRQQKGMSGRLAEIANNDRVGAMNAQQCADYLRTTTNTRKARATASRQMTDDVTAAIIKELRNLARYAHLMPADDPDFISTISQMSTGESFRDIFACQDDLEALNAAQILELIGIVGMAACGRVGDYPDPMCYKLEAVGSQNQNQNQTRNDQVGKTAEHTPAIYTHTLYSCGDLMRAWRWAVERQTEPPKAIDGGMITAVIPLMTPEMQAWIMKYSRDPPTDDISAPILLESMAGISMRRMITAVPQTYLYLLVAGYWELLLAKPTELVISMRARLRKLLDPYRAYWDWVKPTWDGSGRMCWIGNNGLSNTLVFARADDPLISHIIHSAFSFDCYQLVRKKSHPDSTGVTRDEFAARVIRGTVSPADDKIYVSELFRWDISTLAWQANAEAVTRWIGHPYWKNAVEICAHFGVTITSAQSLGYLVQSLKYWEKKLRVVGESHPFRELSSDAAASLQITELLSEYADEIRAARKKERRTAAHAAALSRLIMLAAGADRERFCELLKGGLSVPFEGETIHVTITPMNFGPLVDVLPVDERLQMLITGKYRGEICWNNGNFIRRHTAFRRFRDSAEFIAMMRDASTNEVHRYRDAPNRHGHSNDKPSYYAYGFQTIENYRDSVSADEWADYCSQHKGCCGL